MKKSALINGIWLWMILLAVLTAALSGRMEQTTQASFDSAKTAVNLAISLIGIMALWLGLMRVASAGGLLRMIARGIRPVMVRLFPEVPPEHPAMSAMIMNIAANVLGLGNAATPMGLKAMAELDKLNPVKGRATHAMCLFLAINTSNVTLLPLGVIGVRAAAGAADPAAILVPTLLATTCSTLVAVMAAKGFARLDRDSGSGYPVGGGAGSVLEDKAEVDGVQEELIPPGAIGRIAAYLAIVALPVALVMRLFQAPDRLAMGQEILSFWLVPILMGALLLFGYLRGVKVYETATAGAKEGFDMAVRIIPFMVMILVGIGMFRASGAFELMVQLIGPITSAVGMPVDALPMALMRPLSGSGAFGIMSEVVQRAPDSFSSFLVCTINGSSETTFYVLAVYFGAVGVTQTRYAVAAALLADLAGVAAALIVCHLMY